MSPVQEDVACLKEYRGCITRWMIPHAQSDHRRALVCHVAAHGGGASFETQLLAVEKPGGFGVMRRMPTKGYSFATWLRIEEAPHPKPSRAGAAAEPDRALYSLLAPGGAKGICATLRGVLEHVPIESVDVKVSQHAFLAVAAQPDRALLSGSGGATGPFEIFDVQAAQELG